MYNLVSVPQYKNYLQFYLPLCLADQGKHTSFCVEGRNNDIFLSSAVPVDPQRIVGGELTTVNEYPTIVALLYSYFGTNFGQSCGGTILTNRAILTAGHCPS